MEARIAILNILLQQSFSQQQESHTQQCMHDQYEVKQSHSTQQQSMHQYDVKPTNLMLDDGTTVFVQQE